MLCFALLQPPPQDVTTQLSGRKLRSLVRLSYCKVFHLQLNIRPWHAQGLQAASTRCSSGWRAGCATAASASGRTVPGCSAASCSNTAQAAPATSSSPSSRCISMLLARLEASASARPPSPLPPPAAAACKLESQACRPPQAATRTRLLLSSRRRMSSGCSAASWVGGRCDPAAHRRQAAWQGMLGQVCTNDSSSTQAASTRTVKHRPQGRGPCRQHWAPTCLQQQLHGVARQVACVWLVVLIQAPSHRLQQPAARQA